MTLWGWSWYLQYCSSKICQS